MNRVFRIIWSKSLRAWVVVSELARRCGKGGCKVDQRAVITIGARDHKKIGDDSFLAICLLRTPIFMALLATQMPAWGADRYWDSNNTAIGTGGAGIWNTSNTFWSPNSDGVSGPYSAWSNAALDDAFFGGTAGTVTLGGPVILHNLTFLSAGYTLTGSTLTLAGATPSINLGSGVSATIASAIDSSSGLVKNGAGTLSLTGSNSFGGGININGGTLGLSAANTFTGAINVTGGNLNIGAIGDAALGSVGNVINLGSGRTLNSSATISANRTVNLVSGIGNIQGSGLGGVFYTGAGGMNVGNGISLTNNANDYQGQTQFTALPGWSGNSNSFTSIADLGVASALGAPTTVANGTVVLGPGCCQALGNSDLHYTGTGHSSNRNWNFRPGNYAGGAFLYNSGSGTLTLTGAISATGGSRSFGFSAGSGDLNLLGVISSNSARTALFTAGGGRTLRLGTANTFSGTASIGGAGTVEAALISNAGVAGSLGTGLIFINGGNLSYISAGESTNKSFSISNGALNSNGTGAMVLGGTLAIAGNATLGGSFTGADNIISGVISGAGNLRSAGNASWTLTGVNTYTGTTIVNGGALRAGTTTAFGASTAAQVNGGTLDLNGFDRTFSTLSGTGGTVDLGSAILTLEAATGTTATYAGSITGSGGITKLGASTQTLTGASTYTGDTTIGGGILNLDFSPAGGPVSDIIGSGSTLKMNGGRINVTGAAGEANTQTFDGLNVLASNNTLNVTSDTGGSMTVNLGAITRTGGLMNFNLPTNGNITTTNLALGGWATVNGTDYAKVVGGNILAFEEDDYIDKDNAGHWVDNDFVTDIDGFFGTVYGSVQLGGLRYTRPMSTTVTVEPGETLGVDGTIIVAPSVLNTNQVITGGMLTGANGGNLGIQQNSTGNFTISSQIIDNGAPLGFVKAGTGLVTLTNAANSYTGGTTVAQGTLSVNAIGNGGVASGIGASTADSANLSLEGATLSYTGATTTSDRGFTFTKSGAILGSGIEVTNAAANLTFSGLVTSSDGANFTKSGAGILTLLNDANNFTGVTTVTGGLLSVDMLANGGQVSGIGQSGSASANLVLNGGGLQYTGATTSTNRGFTLGANDGTIDVTDGATTLTVSGTAVGPGGTLTKAGAGTLVLSGINTYNAGNTVTGGILRAGSTQAFGGTGTMTLANTAGVSLDLNNFNNTIGQLSGGGDNGGNVTLGSATLTIAGGNGNYSGVISGTGGVTRTSGGNQTFNGCNNTYTGQTYLGGSTISTDCLANGGQASGIGASSNASANLFFDSGALNYTGGTVAIDHGFRLNSGNSTINVTNAATTLTFGGAAIGGGGLVKGSAGTLVLSGNNTYTGDTQVTGGVLRAGSVNAFGPSGHMTVNNTAGVLLDLAGFNTAVTSLIGGGANGGNIALDSATLTIIDGSNQTYAGVISGTGNLIKNGGGNQRLSGCNNTYTGTTTINAGFLSVDCLADGGLNSSVGASTGVAANLVLNGGTLNYVGNGDSTTREFTLGGSAAIASAGSGIIEFTSTAAVTLTGANTARTLTLTGTNTGDNLFAGQLNNNGAGVTSLTKTGTGLWRLTNANSAYTGATTISGGILEVDEFANGGIVSSIGAATSAATNLVIGNGSTLRYTGAGDSTDRQFTLATGVTFIESSGTGALQFTNTGAVSLTGTNTARTIALGGTNTGDNTLGGAIGDNGTGATTLAKNDSGTWVLTGNNTYTGNTVINNGNLMIGNGGTTGNAGAGNVIVDSATSTLSLNRSDTFTFGGTLSGPGTLAQIGTGTSVLTSATNQIGATTISAGTLQINGGLTTPTVDMTGTAGLAVNGSMQAAGNAQTALTGDAGAQTVTVGTGGTLRASGNLGDGADTVDLVGTLDTGTGSLQLGDGDDTLVLNDGAQMLGDGVNTSGGGGTDTLAVNTVLGYLLDGSDIDTFDILTKQNTGALTLTGDHDFALGTNLDAGTLDVDGILATASITMADDTLLNVDGILNAGPMSPTTIIGSAGDNSIFVGSGGLLFGNGDLGAGMDSVTLAGELNTGAGILALGTGDDQLTLQSGAFIAGTGVDAGTGLNDQLVLDSATGLVFDGGQTIGFESLIKQNTDLARMIGSQNFSAGTSIIGGTLDVAGNLTTPTVAMSDGTALNVDGSLQGDSGVAAVITGSTGANSVTVGAGGTLLANGDLGTGNDILNVAGTLDTVAGVLALGDGDDTLTIHDNTNIIGTVEAGAGNNTLETNIAIIADLGAVQGFQTLDKTGVGTLNINGPLDSDFNTVLVAAGTLDITATGHVVAPPSETLDTVIAAGATLNVDGSYTGSASDDTFGVTGTVSGSGSIDLADGADTLTLNDGAVLTNVISGGAGSDTLVLNNILAWSFDGGNTTGFELLQKNNTGVATVTGTQTFNGGTTLNAGSLILAGAFETPTVNMADDTILNVEGNLEAGGGTATVVTGSAGTNTVIISGSLLANGDLGDGNDVLDVIDTLDTDGGLFSLGNGDDIFTIHDGTVVLGTVDGGTGLDSFNPDINTVADLGVLTNFEILDKTGTGVLNINGSGLSDFVTVNVQEGMLNLGATGGITGVQEATVAGGASLTIDGLLGFTLGQDTFTVAGSVSGLGSVDMLNGDDTLVIQDGADLSGLTTAINGGSGYDTLTADIAGSAILGGAVGFEMLTKTNIGTFSILGAASSQFDTVLVQGGTLYVGVGAVVDPQTTVIDSGATFTVDGVYTGTVDNDTFEVSGTVNGSGTIDLQDGDDVLTINDGGDISGLVNPLDGSTNTPLGDTVVLNFNNDGSFSGENVINFEHLVKLNDGTATLTGNAVFSGSTDLQGGGLAVIGSLATPILNLADDTLLTVDGSMEGGGGTAAAITGSAGVNTVMVGASGVLLANGDLGDGNDVLDVSGTLNTAAGVFSLGNGSDILTIHDGTVLLGTVDGGAGLDNFNSNINTNADLGALINFEILNKTGIGVLNINGPAQSDFGEINVLEGMLNIAATGGISGVQNATVASGAILNLDGSLSFTTGADTLTVAGTVTGGGTLDLGDGNDTFTVQDGADLSGLAAPVDGGSGSNTLVTDIAGSATLGGVTNFQTLDKTNTGTLIVAGPAPSDFTTVNVAGGTLDVGVAGNISDVVTTTVVSGATLNVDGSYSGSTGDDTMVVSGDVSGSGTISLGDGDDVLTLNDGAELAAVIDGGAHGAGDTVVLNNAGTLEFDGSNTINFEFLQKDNTGEARLVGAQSFTAGTLLNGGTLTLAGMFETPTLAMGDDTTLNVEGRLEAGGGSATTITGSTGVNTVIVGAGGVLLANGDLGDGNDVLDVFGTLDTNGGSFLLGAGDDTFTVHDGTVVLGTVDGGDGFDTRIYDINLSADLGVLLNFEGVTKTGTGVLNVTGPGATDLQQVEVLGGTLDVHAGASIVATAGESLDTFVAGGATLNVDGAFGCGDDDDTMTVSGTLSGSGSIDLCGGNDMLTLNDGADIAGLVNSINGNTGIDTVVLNNANPFTLDALHIAGFEVLQKDNIGTATLTGDHLFNNGTRLNQGTLTATGELITPSLQMGDNTVLNVGALLAANGGTAALISGSSGVNTVNVAAGALMIAQGDLGDGDDILNLAGTLDTSGGVFNLGAGDDTFTIHDGTVVLGTVDGGAGLDTFNPNINTTADLGALVNFEILTKTGVGLLNITGPGTSTFNEVNVNEGILNLAPAAILTAPIGESLDVTLAAGATLIADGSLLGGDGTDTLTVAGTVTGNGTIHLGDGDDVFTIQDGADLSSLTTPVNGGSGSNTLITDIAGSATLGGVTNFQTLDKTNTGTLIVAGPAPSDFTTVNVAGGTLDVGVAGNISDVVTTTVASGATLHVDGSYSGSTGDDTMIVSGEVSGSGTISLAAGDDVLTLNDGAELAAVIDGGAHGAGDTVVLNNAGTLEFDGSNTINFEFLQKDNTGEARLVGAQSFTAGTLLNGGTLTLAGMFETPTLAMGDDTTLNVEGRLEAGGGSATTITGSTGVNTVMVGAAGVLLASGDLGDGNDVLDVNGTLDTNGGSFLLGAGDDTFTVHDGTVVLGTVDGGDGFDTRVYDINLSADLGVLLNFEGVTKTGTGVLNVTGPGATDLQQVEVLGGTLDVHAGASIVATAGESLDTFVAGGATLNVDGAFGCGDDDDTMTVSGTLSGSGSIDLCGGNDMLTLNDGADIAGLVNSINGNTGIDTVVLNNANPFTLDALHIAGFEVLQKDNIGTATLTGDHLFSNGTLLNQGTLTATGELITPSLQMGDNTVLNVGALLAANGGTAALISGSSGVNTVNVAAGALMIAQGDLGDGEDILNLAGTLDTSGGVFNLGAGDDTFTIHDDTVVLGTVDGGAGLDTFNPNINTTADLSALVNFEILTKTGVGLLNITGPGTSTFNEVNVNEGILNLAPAAILTAPIGESLDVTLAAGATLIADGSLLGGDGTDTLTVAGTVTGNGTIHLGDGNDVFTIQDGADLSDLLNPVDGGNGGDTFVADLAGEATLGGAVNFETLTKSNTGILHVAGPAQSNFATVNVLGGMLDVGINGEISGVQNATVASGATLNLEGSLLFTTGDDTLTVAGTVTGGGTLDLGDGNDTFIIQDGANLSSLTTPVNGGSGGNTLITDIAGSATLGGVTNFQTLDKINIGTLIVAGPAPSDFTTVNVVGGTLHVGVAGNISDVVTTTVAGGATLRVDGSYSGSTGDDTMVVSGDVSGSGTISLGDGDDVLTLNDGAELVAVIDGGAHGAGDTVVLNNAGTLEFDASNTINFEFLQKDNTGEARLVGAQSFTAGTLLNGGTLTLAGMFETPTLAMADNTLLNVEGRLEAGGGSATTITGSTGVNTVMVRPGGRLLTDADLGSGDDVFTSDGGLLMGSLAFGAGDDTATFIGSDISGLTAIDGGSGGNDAISFHNAELNGDTLPISNWERLNLFDNTRLNLSSLLELNGGLVNIDTNSALFASNGASINASIYNAGLIDTGTSRLTISGNYTGANGLLQVEVSPVNGTSGGLDITGNISGTTGVIFASDGTDVTESTAIKVITSVNSAPDAFRAADSDDGRIVRLQGSILPWTFAQDENDNNWYLSTEADRVLPELPAYASLQSLSVMTIRQTDNLIHQRLAGARGTERPECDLSPEERTEQANTHFLDDCNGFWTAIKRDELELGGNQGFEVSGDDVGLYVGVDGAVDRPGRTLRGGAYLGFNQGNYLTTGNGSAELSAISAAAIDLETLTGGFYTSTTWNDGTYFNAILNGNRPRAVIETADGFKEELTGNSLTLDVRIGRNYRLEHNWMIEPQFQVSASMVNWSDVIDPAGKQLVFNNEVVSTVRAGVRVSKEVTWVSGTVIRPWTTLAALQTMGQSDDQLSVQSSSKANAQTLLNHDLGTSATLDIGLEVTLNERFSAFGVVSTGKGIEGTDLTQHSGYLGMRIRW